jgi:hypothetical protein
MLKSSASLTLRDSRSLSATRTSPPFRADVGSVVVMVLVVQIRAFGALGDGMDRGLPMPFRCVRRFDVARREGTLAR